MRLKRGKRTLRPDDEEGAIDGDCASAPANRISLRRRRSARQFGGKSKYQCSGAECAAGALQHMKEARSWAVSGAAARPSRIAGVFLSRPTEM